MTNEKVRRIRKNNMKLYPIYSTFGIDLMFFYGIKILFLTGVKGISVADIVFSSGCYAFFRIFLQIPLNVIVEKLGNRKSLLIGNILNALYVVVILFSTNLAWLILAEFISCLAFGFKSIAEPALLNVSIPTASNKGEIFSKIMGKGKAGYYYIDALATLVAGFLFEINPYIPIVLSILVACFSILISFNFVEIKEETKSKQSIKQSFWDIKIGFKFILQSGRLKGLLLFSGVMWAFLCLYSNYQIDLLKDIQVSAKYIGIILAIMEIVAGIASNKQNKFHKMFRKRSLTVMGLSFCICNIIGGLIVILHPYYGIMLGVILITYFIFYIDKGLYGVLIKKYLRNFTSSEILNKIYSADEMTSNAIKVITSFVGSAILGWMSTSWAMVVMGGFSTLIMVLLLRYMKTRIGLKPEEYKKEEIYFREVK